MKLSFIFAIAFGLAGTVSAQSKPRQLKSPEEVLREFVKMDLAGARLTPEGRGKTAHLLIRPSPAPPDVIDIVSDNFEVQETTSTQGRAKLSVSFFHFYGWLDSALRFKPTLRQAPGGGIILEGITADYALVLTDKYWELEPDGRELKEATGAPEWRIESPQVGTISLATAIRYVGETRDRATDRAIKNNADHTLGKLMKLH